MSEERSDEPGPPGAEDEVNKQIGVDKCIQLKETDSSTPDHSKLSKHEKSLLNNRTLEEDAALRRNTSMGAILSGLSSGSYGNKAKENVVKIEGGEKRRYDGFGYSSGYGTGYSKKFHGGWDNQTWNTWGEEDEYPEEDTDDQYTHQSNEEWIAAETKFLEEQYGEGIISVIDDEELGFTYVCEVCQVQLNAKKNLDSHMNGMKHLKKLNLWEKKWRQNFFTDVSAIPEGGKAERRKEEVKTSSVEAINNPVLEDSRLSQRYQGFQNRPQPGYGNIPSGQEINAPRGNRGNFSKAPVPPPTISTAMEPPSEQDTHKPKSSLADGSTGTLLQKLAACSVKNFNDSDLATNVIISLVKTLKEYNHKKGDTNAIEVLTEIDCKLQDLKGQTGALNDEVQPGSSSKVNMPDENKKIKDRSTWYAQSDSSASTSTHPPPGARVVNPHPKNTSYGSGKSNASSYNVPSYSYSLPVTTPSNTQSAQTGNYDTSYPSYDTSTQAQKAGENSGAYDYSSSYATSTEDNYYSQKSNNNSYSGYQGHVAPQTAVMDIIQSTSAPPPPPPPPENENTYGYSAQGYQGYPAYFAQPPPPHGY